ncbi:MULTISPECIES: hypothetical protein [unclassified Rathayibacter]|uniref:hypothetical protein n=1 Tax=unclassified Rathayibacter TaxID=2609250 RepID=UPI0006F4DB42|nr:MULTISPECIES: hypothetical protein [unclassified Rathayibacter]KQQ03340.1 hypothetical protein ASF42_07340 [Rathayibacter sp. Leaf294]KQS11794.1 hypothetical protein ASG06_07340 [Rathayibacter sp. Leaf185]
MILGYVLAVVLAAVLSAVFVRAFDALGPVWNGGWQLRVSGEATPEVSADELYRELASLVEQRGIDLVRHVADSDDPATVRHLFVAGHGAAAELLRDGYGAVDTSRTTTVAPLLDLGSLDPRGAYLVGGERDDAVAVLAVMQAEGWAGEVSPYASGIDVDTYREYGDLMRVLGIALLGVAVLVGAGTLLRSRAHGVQRLHGAGSMGILLTEWRHLAPPVLVLSLGGLAALAGAGSALNGLAQLPTIAVLFTRLLGLLLLAAVVAHVLSIALTDGRRVIDQVKGEIDGWWVLVGVYAVRVPAVLVLLAVVAALGQSARVADVESRSREFWSTAGDAVTIALAGYASEDEYRAAVPELAALVESQASSGRVVLVEPSVGEERDVLLVNEGYLAAVQVLGSDGERLLDVPDGVITVLEPEDTGEERRQSLLADLRSWQEIQVHVQAPASGTAGLPIAERIIPSGQTLYTFRTLDSDLYSRETTLDDPIVIVVPSVSVVAPSELFSAITRGAVVFTAPESIPEAVEERGLSRIVASITPVAYQANEQYQRALGTHSINLIGLAGGALVVLLTGLIAAVVLVEKDRQRAFVHHFSGLGPLSAHRKGLLLEGVLLAATLVLAVVPMWLRDPRDVQTVLDLGTVDTETFVIEQTALAVGLTVLSGALLVACLGLAHVRAARSRSVDS